MKTVEEIETEVMRLRESIRRRRDYLTELGCGFLQDHTLTADISTLVVLEWVLGRGASPVSKPPRNLNHVCGPAKRDPVADALVGW